MPGPPPIGQIISALQHRDVVSYFNIVASMTFIYDFLLTFNMELQYIWSAPWTVLKVAYFLQRYLPFFDTVALSIYHGSAPNLSPSYCQRNYYATIYLDMISMIGISEAILTFRTWAVWSRDKRLGAAMAIVFTAFFASSATFALLFLKGMQFGTLPIPHFPGCFITGGNSYLTGSWVLLMVYDAWMMSMMLFPPLAGNFMVT